MSRLGLVVACTIAAILVTAAVVLRVLVVGADAMPLPERLLPALVAAALLLLALLALPRSHAIGWAAASIAGWISTIEIVGAIRSLEPVVTASAWRDLSALAGISVVAAGSVAAGYAARGWSRSSRATRLALALAGAGLLATIIAAGWAVAATEGPAAVGELSPLRTAVRIGLMTITGGVLLGIVQDVGPAFRRAYARSRVAPTDDSTGPVWLFLRHLGEELSPGRDAGRRLAAESERARLAADLHALVIPDLRRAAATAEATGAPPDLQVDLRRALEDVEQLMHERQSIVLEQFGLVAALEWLAERTEERSAVRVGLELNGDVPDGPAGLDSTIARAAFRIALLALDNVVRHARATTVTLRLSVGGDGLHLIVVDDGTAQRDPAARGRGLTDMRAEAAVSGGSIEISFENGVRVAATWPYPGAARNHAYPRVGTTDRSRTSAS